MMEEIWKEVEGYENYEVSNMGRVRSVDREIYQEGIGLRKLKGRPVKPWHNGYGYYKVCLGSYVSPDGKRKHPTEYVHRLVARAFIDNPNNLPVVDHIDFNRANNCVENLRWVSQRTNILHSLPNQPIQNSKTRRTNTGYKYITEKRRVQYGVSLPIDHKRRISNTFDTLEEAVEWRNQKVKEIGIECNDN